MKYHFIDASQRSQYVCQNLGVRYFQLIACSVCHDSHSTSQGNPYGLRTGSAGTACDTCHYEKWQIAILEGMAGEVNNGYHYPGQDYSIYAGSNNPHRTTDKCVLCHMSRAVTDVDGSRREKGGRPHPANARF
jgi:hypothetical protein